VVTGNIIHREFFWSKASAEKAGYRLQKRHNYSFSVRYAMRADMSHDWLLEVAV
jgi:hypothetical protein